VLAALGTAQACSADVRKGTDVMIPDYRRRRARLTCGLLVCFVVACGEGISGSESAQQDCVDCELVVQARTIIGLDGPGVGPLGSIVRDPAGRYYLSHVYSEAEVAVYRADGTFDRTIGRPGSGPGEYSSIHALDIAGDSLHVFNGLPGRQTVHAFDGEVVRTRPLMDRITGAWILRDRRVLVHSVCPPRDCPGPLHLYDDSAHLLSFGGVAEDDARPWTAFTPDANGIWTARRGQHSLYLWSFEGLLTDSIHRNASWFPAHQITPFQEGIRPGGVVRALHLDSEGRLWIVSHIADDRWAAQFQDGASPDMRFTGNVEQYYDSVVEVWDRRTGRVLASSRYDEYITRMTNAGELVIDREAGDGTPYLEVWQVALPD
jgi:hypothetical protein